MSSDPTPLFSSNSRKEGVVVNVEVSSDPTPLFSSNSRKEREGVVVNVEVNELRFNPTLL